MARNCTGNAEDGQLESARQRNENDGDHNHFRRIRSLPPYACHQSLHFCHIHVSCFMCLSISFNCLNQFRQKGYRSQQNFLKVLQVWLLYFVRIASCIGFDVTTSGMHFIST